MRHCSVCPSVDEPFGIITRETTAGTTPVVAAALVGTPRVLVTGQTGTLVPFEPARRCAYS